MDRRHRNAAYNFAAPILYVSNAPGKMTLGIQSYCTNRKLITFVSLCMAWCIFCGYVAFYPNAESISFKDITSWTCETSNTSWRLSYKPIASAQRKQREIHAHTEKIHNATQLSKPVTSSAKKEREISTKAKQIYNTTKLKAWIKSEKNDTKPKILVVNKKVGNQTIVNVPITPKVNGTRSISEKNNVTNTKIKKPEKKKKAVRIRYRVGHSNLQKSLRNDTIYIIMPTYARQIQRPLLIMQAQVFSQVPNIHIVVAENAETPSDMVKEIMSEHKLNFTQVACALPTSCNTMEPCLTKKNVSGRGAVVRNCALQWLQKSDIKNGILYFADDDNFYQLNLFKELRKTRKVALFPVAGFSGTWLSSILVKNGKIVDFTDIWKGNRQWPIDMSGFSVSIRYWRDVGCPKFIFTAGYLETKFLAALKVTKDDIDVLGDKATKIYVWHNSIRKDNCMKPEYYDKLKKLEAENFDNIKSLTKGLIPCADEKT